MKKQIITINVPEAYLEAIETFVASGIFTSRSETVRVAIEEFLKNEKELNHDLDPKYLVKLGV